MAATAPASGSVDLAAARVSDLHALYGESVYRYCRKRLRSHEDAEDAAQIVFLNAHRALAQGVEPRSDAAWLFKIAENVVLYRHRTAVRRARNEYPADTNDLHEAGHAAPDMHGVARELAAALSKVPPSQQRAFVLREWQGLPYQTIAAELNVTVEAATALVVRARNNLSRELEKPSMFRRAGSLVLWLLTPVERVFSSGVVLKTAAGVATVVIAVPAAETVIERHAAQAGVPVSSLQTRSRATGPRHATGVVRYARPATVLARSAGSSSGVAGARVHGSRFADVGDVVGETPELSATPDVGAADMPAAGEPAQAEATAGGDPGAAAPADQGVAAAGQASDGGASTPASTPTAASIPTPPPPPTPTPAATGNAGHPATRPTLPPTSKGKPPANPGSKAIPRAGDDGNAS